MNKRLSHFEKVQRRRYDAHAFRNPLVTPPKKRRWPAVLGGILCLALLGAGAWLLLTAQIFAVTSVQVSGNETVSTFEITQAVQSYLSQRVLWAFARSNRFLLNQQALTKNLTSNFSFASVSLDRSGHVLDIHVQERVSGFLWRSGSDYYLADTTGTLVRALTPAEADGLTQPDPPPQADGTLAPETRLKRLPVYADVNAAAVAPGATVLSQTEVTGSLAFEQDLLGQGIPFTEIDVDRLAGEWMAAKTLAGYQILFDPTQDVDGQATRLAALLHNQLKSTSGLTYIDLRFGDHVYYK